MDEPTAKSPSLPEKAGVPLKVPSVARLRRLDDEVVDGLEVEALRQIAGSTATAVAALVATPDHRAGGRGQPESGAVGGDVDAGAVDRDRAAVAVQGGAGPQDRSRSLRESIDGPSSLQIEDARVGDELPSGLVEIAVEGPLKAETKAV